MFGGEVGVFGGEASPLPPPALDRTLMSNPLIEARHLGIADFSTASCHHPLPCCIDASLFLHLLALPSLNEKC